MSMASLGFSACRNSSSASLKRPAPTQMQHVLAENSSEYGRSCQWLLEASVIDNVKAEQHTEYPCSLAVPGACCVHQVQHLYTADDT